MPAIDVFWLNHSMTFLPNKPPQLTVATRGHRPPLAQWPEDAGFTLPEDTSPPQTSYRLDNRDCGGAAKNSGENRVVVSPRKTKTKGQQAGKAQSTPARLHSYPPCCYLTHGSATLQWNTTARLCLPTRTHFVWPLLVWSSTRQAPRRPREKEVEGQEDDQ